MLDALPGLVMKAVNKAEGNPDAQAEIVEVQARMLGVSIAVMTKGNDKATDELLEGACHYAVEQAASTKQTNKLMDEALKRIRR